MTKPKKFFAVNEVNWGHRWGYKDTAFNPQSNRSVSLSGNRYDICGKTIPGLIPFAEEVLGITVLPEPQIKEVKKKHIVERNINKPFMDDIVSMFEKDRYCFNLYYSQ